MNLLVFAPVLVPLIGGAALSLIVPKGTAYRKMRQMYVSGIIIITAILVLLVAVTGNKELRFFELTEAINIYFYVDGLSRFFMVLATGIWLLVMFYIFEHIENDGKDNRFFSFFLATFGAVLGACLSGNFFTLYLFYEFITLLTYPLVVHFGTPDAMKGGNKYLMYSFSGAALTLIGFIVLTNFGEATDFTAGGILDASLVYGNETVLLIVFVLAFIGLGTKAYIWPMFDWVPSSYPQAPAPAAALFSGIVSKVAVLAIIRLIFFMYGYEFILGTWAQTLLIVITLLTVFIGSMLAYREKLLLRRLAYSSVSQLSYVLFGLILLSYTAFLGAMLHVMFHAIIKAALFLSAGAIIRQTNKEYVDELNGIGKSMPITMWCFTMASIALVGIPPTGGFISKWNLAMGSIETGTSLGLVGAGILLISALLTAGYLMSIVTTAFFPGAKFNYESVIGSEPTKLVFIPLIILASLSLILGMFPAVIINFISTISGLIFV